VGGVSEVDNMVRMARGKCPKCGSPDIHKYGENFDASSISARTVILSSSGSQMEK